MEEERAESDRCDHRTIVPVLSLVASSASRVEAASPVPFGRFSLRCPPLYNTIRPSSTTLKTGFLNALGQTHPRHEKRLYRSKSSWAAISGILCRNRRRQTTEEPNENKVLQSALFRASCPAWAASWVGSNGGRRCPLRGGASCTGRSASALRPVWGSRR